MTRVISLLLLFCPLSLIAGGGQSKASVPALEVQVSLFKQENNEKVSSDQLSYLPKRKTQEYSINRAPKDGIRGGAYTLYITTAILNQETKKAMIKYRVTVGSQLPENREMEVAFGDTSEKTPLSTNSPLYVIASVIYLSSKDKSKK